MDSPDLLNIEQVDFLYGWVTMGGKMGGCLELPQKTSTSVGLFSSLYRQSISSLWAAHHPMMVQASG